MIIQGSNQPITVTFDAEISTFKDYAVCLSAGSVLKEWTKSSSDVSVSGKVLTCSMTQAETFSFPAGPCRIEVKWSDSTGTIWHTAALFDTISKRVDTTVLGVS